MADIKRHRVLFIIPNLEGGGAERVLVGLIRRISRASFEPHLALMNKRGVYLDDVPADVRVYDLKKGSTLSFFGLQRRIAGMVRRIDADAVLTFINYSNIVALSSRRIYGWKCPVIVSERTTLGPSLKPQRFVSLKKFLVRGLYPQAEAVIAVSEGVKTDLIESFAVPKDKIEVIYNPLDIDRLRALAQEDGGGPPASDIIAVGRLTGAKDYPTLLRAFRHVRMKRDAHLVIAGEGEERGALQSLAVRLGVEGSVVWAGFVQNPYALMARSKVFVLSSAWEGFANVLPEAMACGTAVVATDCRSSPGEIIENGVTGLLVPVGDDRALADAILSLLEDDGLRERLTTAAARRVKEFRCEKIISDYESLLADTIRRYSDG